MRVREGKRRGILRNVIFAQHLAVRIYSPLYLAYHFIPVFAIQFIRRAVFRVFAMYSYFHVLKWASSCSCGWMFQQRSFNLLMRGECLRSRCTVSTYRFALKIRFYNISPNILLLICIFILMKFARRRWM